MKLAIGHLVYATIILATGFDEATRRRLSKRLAALRPWPSVRFRLRGH